MPLDSEKDRPLDYTLDVKMWAEFERLRHLWSTRAEASGGVHALAGFRFQLAASLLRLARAKTQSDRPRVFIEALSDIVNLDDGYLIVTQAKLTLRSAEFKKALKELWDINGLARSQTPDLVPLLRYRVLTSSKILKDVEAALARWHPETEVDAEALTVFRSRISVGVDTDPEITLAVYMMNALGDPNPFGSIEKWMGRLLLNPTSAGFDESCRIIATELDALEIAARERAHRFHVWSIDDRPPAEPRLETDLEKATLVGQTPTRSHLTEGRFAPRSLYDKLHHETEQWLARTRTSSDVRMPVYWISGRSGSGKSVALLHLLAELHAADDRRAVIWLDQQADRLADAVRWARPFFATGREVIFASDDPYTAERYQRVIVAIDDAQRELDSALIAFPEMIRPALIFCGPTEQSQYFEDDLTDRVVIEKFSLPEETQPDLDELKHWYTRRTGRTNFAIDTGDDALIVQLFFEWATGAPIREFAQRFRQRLTGMARNESSRTVFELVAEILALNRLYALFPAQAIQKELENNIELGTAFDRLKELERHFSFDPEKGGYRLTHPHLANALYTAWFGRQGEWRHRKAHMRAGIEAAFVHGDSTSRRFAPLWAIARLASGRTLSDAAQRLTLIAPELHELLVELYGCHFAGSKTPLSDLPVWADLNSNLNLKLSPPPLTLIADAVKCTDRPVPGLRLACHKLLEHNKAYPDAAKIVANVLNNYPQWLEWRPVATDYLKSVGLDGIEDSLGDFVARRWMEPTTRSLIGTCLKQPNRMAGHKVTLLWLEASPKSDSAWPGVFTEFIDVFQFCDASHALASDFLRQQGDHSSWSHVWERLHACSITDRAQSAAIARSWLDTARPDISGWDRVWEELWRSSDKSDPDLQNRGRKWLDEVSADHSSWKYVWKELWLASGRSDDLRARGRKWLDDASADHGGWKYVWEELWLTSGKSDSELHERALKWLDEAPAYHGSWAFMWRELWQASEKSDVGLRTRGRKWLDEAPASHGSWAFMWQELWEAFEKSDDLRAQARKWLEDAPDHRSWTYVWDELWLTSEKSDDLRMLGQQWLDKTPADHAAWKYVWGELWLASEKSDDLRMLGRRWLDKAPADHTSWKYVWDELWLASEKSDDMRMLGRRWLDKAPADHTAWKYVWEELWLASGKSDTDLLARGRRWLDETPADHGSWKYVWEELWLASGKSDADLLARARRWLDEAPADHGSWKYVWEELWLASGKADDDLLARGRRWLEEAPPDHGSWKYVWDELWLASGKADADLEAKGRRWLDDAPIRHGSWTFMWLDLWQLSGNSDAELRAQAERWLTQVSARHRSWGHLWRELWRDRKNVSQRIVLSSIAVDWMGRPNFDNTVWPIVWNILWDQSDLEKKLLLDIAVRLLLNVPPKDPVPVQRRINVLLQSSDAE